MELHQSILNFLHNFSREPKSIDRLVSSAFLYLNNLELSKNKFLKQYHIQKYDDDFDDLLEFIKLLKLQKEKYSFEHLIKIFEFVISPSDKVVNGAVYTPNNIRKAIISETSTRLSKSSIIGDISCGCGGFLIDYSILLNKKFGKSFQSIFRDNIFGVDIADYSVNRTKILLSLLALSKGEDKEFTFNFYVGNSLNFDWFKNSLKVSKNGGFDIIVGNPPYVTSSNMDDSTKKLLKNWSVSKTGKGDLYIPFFEIAMYWLKNKGVLGYITVNTFIKSLNGHALRNFFSKNSFRLKIIDFGNEQVFKGRMTYTTICIVQNYTGNISYVKESSKNLENLKETDYEKFDYEFLNNRDGWRLSSELVDKNINKIISQANSLGELFEIRNGFATLKNDLYIFKPEKEDDIFYYHKKDGKEYKIEKGICRNVIKPNILKKEEDISRLKEKIVFPYSTSSYPNGAKKRSKSNILEESEFQNSFPYAYKYLEDFKNELKKRDNGNKTYPAWYAYGRSQAIGLKGKKLLFPYISDRPIFVFTDDEELLFYNGFAIISDCEEELRFIKKILTSRIFLYFISNTSKPYSHNYYSYGKRYVKNFGIPEFSNRERKQILNYKRQSSVDKLLMKKYQIEI